MSQEQPASQPTEERHRAQELGLAAGEFSRGPLNSITDVSGVQVGQLTLWQGSSIRTGVTAILPHGGNVFQEKVPAGVFVGNGFGKLTGSTQINELGEIETPILLTNTLAVARAADALVTWTLAQPGNERVVSINPVVGETNDSWLNDIRRRPLQEEHFLTAIKSASGELPREGAAGAGTGTMTMGWKGGIGTSSRRIPAEHDSYTVGVLVQSNFPGELRIKGQPFRTHLETEFKQNTPPPYESGSIMIMVATDAPLADRNLRRLAFRAMAGLARSGAAFSNGSGDYALAFSNAEAVRRTPARALSPGHIAELPNNALSPLFRAVSDACEEAIYNSLFMAVTTGGFGGHIGQAVPLSNVKQAFSIDTKGDDSEP